MYLNVKNMNQRCFRVLNVLSENVMKGRKTFVVSGSQARNINTWHTFSLVKKVESFKFLTAIRLSNSLERHEKIHLSSNNGREDKEEKSKLLMNFSPVVRPEFFLSLKNWILTKFIIQPYLDKDFTLSNFTLGAKQALECVSAFLSQGDLDSLKGLLTDEAIAEIKGNLSSFNMKERQELALRVKDIVFSFPYQIGIIFDDSNQKRFAEITVVYHCLNDYEELKGQGKLITDVQQDIKICNYRFIREYTKGVDSDWTINRLGHFKLKNFEF